MNTQYSVNINTRGSMSQKRKKSLTRKKKKNFEFLCGDIKQFRIVKKSFSIKKKKLS